MPQNWKNRIRELRTQLNMSQEAAAKAINVSLSTWQKMERPDDEGAVRVQDLAALCLATGTSADWILFGTGTREHGRMHQLPIFTIATPLQAAKLYLAGKITDTEWQQFVGIDRRFTATHNAAVEAFRIYLDAKDKDPQATWAQHGLSIAMENVWTVIREAQTLIDAWSNRAE